MNSKKAVAGAVAIVSLIFTAFQVYTSTHGLMTALLQRGIHLTFVLMLVFLIFPSMKNSRAALFIDIPLGLISLASGIYLYLSFDDLIYRLGDPNQWDIFFGVLTILILIEATRRIVGIPMTIIAVASLLYALYGNYLPEPFGHSGRSFERIISQIYLTTEGIYGVPLGVSATYVFLFILFGSFMDKSGVGGLFIELAHSIAGKYRGGPAKIAIISSGAVGMVSGSPVSDAATTGAFTIPLMKRMGYKPELAAAIEAVAASGASLVPPIMGAGAFVMADITGISYSTIIVHAIIPAFLYYLALMFVVDYEARKAKMVGLPKEQLPSFKAALSKSLRLIIPIAVLIFYLAVLRTSPLRAALYALFVMIAMAVLYNFIKPETRVPLKNFYEALVETPRKVLVVSVACATAGIIIGTLGLTGLGLKMADLLIGAAHGYLPLALVFAMLVSIVLGMGLPPTACYIIMAVTTAPALVKMGVPLLVSHFYVFFYCCYAPITPPVALAAYTTAGIAGCNPMKAGLQAARISISGFILPFMVVYGNALLGIGSWADIVEAIVSATIGVWALSIVLTGWFRERVNVLWRCILSIGSLMLITPGIISDVVGLGVVVIFVLTNSSILKKKAPAVAGNQ